MFGEKIDYWLLRPLAHSRNRATEEELDNLAKKVKFDSQAARRRLDKLLIRFQGRLKIVPELSYLDVGCGSGDIILALVQAGARDVTGIDVLDRQIEAARVAVEQATPRHAPVLMVGDIICWSTPRRFDVVLSNEALEHIDQPDRFIKGLYRLLNPNGSAYLAFGDLFHSPFGDHLQGFFRATVPWRGVLFSEKALMAIRTECFRPGDRVERFKDVRGGLNQMRYSEFLRYVQEAGFDLAFLSLNPQLKRMRPLYWLSSLLSKIPIVQDYVVSSVYAQLVRRSGCP